jgi:hypothetical protein
LTTLNQHEITSIKYTKESTGETTSRVIIPTFIPKPNVKAIDVTDVDHEGRMALLQQLKEYGKYVQAHHKAMFSFEDWAEHTCSQEVSVKWRTFKIENTEII